MKTTPKNQTTDGSPSRSASCSAFVVGAWFTMEYGFERYKFYIAEVAGSRFRISRKGWCSTDGVWMTREEMEGIGHRAEYIGQGQPKRLWKWLPWKDLVVPFLEPND